MAKPSKKYFEMAFNSKNRAERKHKNAERR